MTIDLAIFRAKPVPRKRRIRVRRMLLAVPLALVCLGAPAQADFMAAWHAYQRGEYASALKQWRAMAEQGDAAAQYNVGVMYDEGTGVDPDPEKVVAWWRKAAEQDHVMAQHNLSLLFIERGGEANFRRAARWLKRAAAAGFVRSQHTLGKLYATGLGVEKDDALALEHFLKAGNAGFVKAQYNLGKIYRDGLGVEADPDISVAWFKKAAEQGYAKAQEKLATRYARGVGVENDLSEALKWAILATRQGRSSSAKIDADLRSSMSAQQIAEAESRARAFRPIAEAVQ